MFVARAAPSKYIVPGFFTLARTPQHSDLLSAVLSAANRVGPCDVEQAWLCRELPLQGCSKRLYDKAAGSLNAEAYPCGTLRWAND